jgi:polysaccharide export outer membrane protein
MMKTAPSRCLNRWIAAASLMGVVSLASGGCATGRYTDFSAFMPEKGSVVSSSDYRIMPPDVVFIDAKQVREIHGHREQVRSDGYVTLPLLGSVYVADKTPEQVSVELETLARQYYDDADVTLRVSGYNSQKVYVFGEVASPGAYTYTGATTILQMMAMAQPTRLANTSRIHIHRPDKNGVPLRRMTIDLDKMVKNGDTKLDAVLDEGDIIYVPPTGFAAVGLALQQILLPIIPAASVVSGPADVYNNTQQTPYTNGGSSGP